MCVQAYIHVDLSIVRRPIDVYPCLTDRSVEELQDECYHARQDLTELERQYEAQQDQMSAIVATCMVPAPMINISLLWACLLQTRMRSKRMLPVSRMIQCTRVVNLVFDCCCC